MENTKFEIEGQIEEPESENQAVEEEEIEEEKVGRGKGIYILLAIFIILFLTSASMFVYYQFYSGNGKWSFSLEKQVSGIQNSTELVKEIEILKATLDSLKLNPADSSASFQELFTINESGEIFEVQIGYFKNFDFTKYASVLVNMNVEVASGGAQKLLVGRFTTFEEACSFRSDLESLGIQGAFVVKKVDGKRVTFDQKCE